MTWLKNLWTRIKNDELKVARWTRAIFITFSTSGLAFADQLAAMLGNAAWVTYVRVAAVVAGFISLAITAGQKNPPPAQP
jgi:hypothetical protein